MYNGVTCAAPSLQKQRIGCGSACDTIALIHNQHGTSYQFETCSNGRVIIGNHTEDYNSIIQSVERYNSYIRWYAALDACERLSDRLLPVQERGSAFHCRRSEPRQREGKQGPMCFLLLERVRLCRKVLPTVHAIHHTLHIRFHIRHIHRIRRCRLQAGPLRQRQRGASSNTVRAIPTASTDNHCCCYMCTCSLDLLVRCNSIRD